MGRRTEPKVSQRSPLWIAFSLALLLCSFCFLPRVSANPRLLVSVGAAAASLLVLAFFVRSQAARAGRILTYQFVLRPVHYVQLIMHSCVYVYWGWYWREVYHYLPLIAAQIVFTYAFDMLVCWSRRNKWIAGFGPFPIVLSTSLFLWFRDDWFFLQFLLIATGVLGKEFVKWKREGHLTHIFNPSALSLFIFSVGLLATQSTNLTWGIDIATTFHRPPHIYLEIFLLGLVVQALFQVTLVTLSSAAALYLLNVLYTRITGDYQFIDSNIPVAVFLGLHLLVTDPATSPRKGFGKIVFGALYGASVFGAYSLLKVIHAPEFYDKLLCVPPLNLSVRLLDRVSDVLAVQARKVLGAMGTALTLRPPQANYAWMGVWACLFVTMMTTGFLTKGKDHPGGNPLYWAKACQQGRQTACHTWVNLLKGNCQDDSRADCFTLGAIAYEGKFVPQDKLLAGVSFGRACDLGLSDACTRLMSFVREGGVQVFLPACDKGDGASCFILGSLFSSGQGLPPNPAMAFELFQKSCDTGWSRGCGRLGISYVVGQGTAVNPSLAIANFEKGCQGRNAASCLEAAQFYRSGKLGFKAENLAQERLQQACDLGLKSACRPQSNATSVSP
jgi:hypothetical protein